MYTDAGSGDFDTEENVVRYMNSTYLDKEYRIEHNWKMCFMHPYHYLEHPKYQEKRKELQKSNKSTREHLGFLLFSRLFGGNNCIPILNKELMEVMSMSKTCPQQRLGSNCEGVSLFKSIDVLLKFASQKRCKSPLIAVYKFLEGSPKVKSCEVDENIFCETLDSNYDSFSLKLNSGELEDEDLNNQLRFTEIFFYDTKQEGCFSAMRSYPRQTTPVTLISFLPLLFVVPQPVIQNPYNRKYQRLEKRCKKKTLKRATSADSNHLHNGIRFVSCNHEIEDTHQNSCSCNSDLRHPDTQASELNVDLLNEAAMCAGLLNTPPSGRMQQCDRQPEQSVEELLSGLDSHSINSLCRDAGINLGHDAAVMLPDSQNSAVGQETTQSKDLCSLRSTSNIDCTNSISDSQMLHTEDKNMQNESATQSHQDKIRDYNNSIGDSGQIPQIITTVDGLLMIDPQEQMCDIGSTEQDMETEQMCDIGSTEQNMETTQSGEAHIENLFDTMNNLLPMPTNDLTENSCGLTNGKEAENVNKSGLKSASSATDEIIAGQLSNVHSTQCSEEIDENISPPLTIESPDNRSNANIAQESRYPQKELHFNCSGGTLLTKTSSDAASDSDENSSTRKPILGIITSPKRNPNARSDCRKRGRPRKRVVLPGEPLPPHRKKAKVSLPQHSEFDYESSTIIQLAVRLRREKEFKLHAFTRLSETVEVRQPVPKLRIRNKSDDIEEPTTCCQSSVTPTKLTIGTTLRNSSRRRRGLSFCQLVSERQARLAVANIVVGRKSNEVDSQTSDTEASNSNCHRQSPSSNQKSNTFQKDIGMGSGQGHPQPSRLSTICMPGTANFDASPAENDSLVVAGENSETPNLMPGAPSRPTRTAIEIGEEQNKHNEESGDCAPPKTMDAEQTERSTTVPGATAEYLVSDDRSNDGADIEESGIGKDDENASLCSSHGVEAEQEETDVDNPIPCCVVDQFDGDKCKQTTNHCKDSQLISTNIGQLAIDEGNLFFGLVGIPRPITPLSENRSTVSIATKDKNLPIVEEVGQNLEALTTVMSLSNHDTEKQSHSVFLTPTSNDDFNTSLGVSANLLSQSFTVNNDFSSTTSSTIQPHEVLSQSFTEGVVKKITTTLSKSGSSCGLSSAKKRRKLFHGLPLLVSKGATPCLIPLECANGQKPRDPRCLSGRVGNGPVLATCRWGVDETSQLHSSNLKQMSIKNCKKQHQASADDIINRSTQVNTAGSSAAAIRSSKPSIKSPTCDNVRHVICGASNYRVNLLMCRETSTHSDAEMSGPGSFYGGIVDEIEFGTSPRDYFPGVSEDEEKTPSAKQASTAGYIRASEEAGDKGLRGVTCRFSNPANRARDELRRLFENRLSGDVQEQ